MARSENLDTAESDIPDTAGTKTRRDEEAAGEEEEHMQLQRVRRFMQTQNIFEKSRGDWNLVNLAEAALTILTNSCISNINSTASVSNTSC